MGRGGKRSHLLSTLEAPPLGCGGLEIVLVSICMCQRDSQCVFHAAALEVPVHLNPVGGEVGRAEPIPAHPLSPSGLAKTASVTPRAGGDGERGLVEVLAEPRLPPSKGWAGAPGAGHFLR